MEKQLFVLAFDHRSSFLKKMFGIENRAANAEETQKAIQAKKIIYEGFRRAVAAGVPKESAMILVDEEFGDEILRDAKKEGFMVALSTEKSGQNEFDFEYGDKFFAHIEKYQPNFVKILVRYNPAGNLIANQKQTEKIKVLSDFCRQNNYKFVFELLVPATENQLAEVNGDKKRYGDEIRPLLVVQAIKELQEAGVKPDIWKIEGMEKPSDYQNLVKQARADGHSTGSDRPEEYRTDGRDQVGVIILGRGENKEQVEKWLAAGKDVEGIVGFAIGRTIFSEPIAAMIEKKLTAEQAAEEISKNYQYFYRLFTIKS